MRAVEQLIRKFGDDTPMPPDVPNFIRGGVAKARLTKVIRQLQLVEERDIGGNTRRAFPLHIRTGRPRPDKRATLVRVDRSLAKDDMVFHAWVPFDMGVSEIKQLLQVQLRLAQAVA